MHVRVLFGLLSILIIVGVVLLDVAIANILLEPAQPGTPALPMGVSESAVDSLAMSPVGKLLSRGSFIPLSIALLLVIGAFEMDRMLRSAGTKPFTTFAIIMILLMILSPWLAAAELLGHRAAKIEGLYWQVVWLGTAIVGGGAIAVIRGETNRLIQNLGATWIMVLYLGFLPSFAVSLRCSRDVHAGDGAWLLVISVLVIKAADIGGYLIGTPLGRTKLLPAVSPGKSVEGSIGGILASIGVALLLTWIGRWDINAILQQAAAQGGTADGLASIQAILHDACQTFARTVRPDTISPYFRAVVFGLALAIFGQMGDLLESGFKRDTGIKDSGHIMPRFGGILDLTDSPLMALPVAWFLLTTVWGVA